MRHALPSFFLAFAAVNGLPAQQTSSALDAVAAAMGGRDRVLAVRTLVLEGTGEMLSFGQNHTPEAETKFDITTYRRSIDYGNRRWLADLTRVPRFTTANTSPQRVRMGVDGYPDPVAYNITPTGAMTRVGGRAADDRVDEFVLHPVGFLLAAYSRGAEVSEEPGANGSTRIRLNVAGIKFAMDVHPRTSLPWRIERIVYHPMLGDVPLHTTLSQWTDVGGLVLPMRLAQGYENLFVLSDLRLTAVRVNADVGNLAGTDSVRAIVQAGQPASPRVAVDSIAPGVWLIGGQSHHTIAIEQSDQIVLVEAPQNDARTLAAIAAARALRPDKPVSLVVNTHHHFDHAGGLRAAASEGLTILTHETNRPFYEAVVMPRRHFIEQDALARSGRGARVRGIRDREVLRDRVRTIELHHVPNPHSGSMLVAYLPGEKLLIQADLYNPPAPTAITVPAFPFLTSLTEFVGRRGLQVERVVGIHGRPVPYSELQAAARNAP